MSSDYDAVQLVQNFPDYPKASYPGDWQERTMQYQRDSSRSLGAVYVCCCWRLSLGGLQMFQELCNRLAGVFLHTEGESVT